MILDFLARIVTSTRASLLVEPSAKSAEISEVAVQLMRVLLLSSMKSFFDDIEKLVIFQRLISICICSCTMDADCNLKEEFF